nr:uncharacterized protein LOC129269578 [Lytechinus pictus]
MQAQHSTDILKVNENITQMFSLKCKKRQQAKFEKLIQPKSKKVTASLANEDKWVVNLSSRQITSTEEQLLKKGLAVSPPKLPITEIVAKVETAVKFIDPVSADAARKDVDSSLQRARPPKPNTTREMRDALKTLKNDDSITILPADKGSATIILDISLFTNVPIEGACSTALQRMQSDPTLSERTTLMPEQIAELLEFVLRSTYFLYRGSFYEQTEGATMGSPVSAVVANLYMEGFEQNALPKCPSTCHPRVWKRYVDDTFIIVNRSETDSLLSYMNSQQPSIQFTLETEQGGKLAFLDTLVQRHEGGKLSTSVYRKPTHTDQYIPFDSHHDKSVKKGLVKCLFDRAARIITHPPELPKERAHIRGALYSNGYPRRFIKNTFKKKLPPRDQKVFKTCTVLPYIDGLSQQLKRRLEGHGIRTDISAVLEKAAGGQSILGELEEGGPQSASNRRRMVRIVVSHLMEKYGDKYL